MLDTAEGICPNGGIPLTTRTPTVLVDRDRLNSAPRKEVAELTIHLFDAADHHAHGRHERQVLALACAFIILCKAAKMKAQDAFTAAANLMADDLHPDRVEHRFAALEYRVGDPQFGF